MESPFVSVVTPFYNSEAYLRDCIESVLRQTYDNYEYVLVNNCSTDRSVEIVEHYVKLHPTKFRLEHNKTFVSQVANYNQALQGISPQSKYCKVLQADDMLFPECLERMVENAEQDSTIGVVGSYSLEGRHVAFGGLPYPSPVVSGRATSRLFFLEDIYIFGSATQLLLRSDLIRSRTPFYDESYIPFEDAAVIFDLLTKCNFGFVHQVLTFTRRDNPSLMSRIANLDYREPFNLLMLRAFGRHFLDSEEYEQQLQRKERIYADLLVDRAISLKEKAYWEFHGSMLKRMGYSFNSPGTKRHLVLGLSHALFSQESAGNFLRGFQRLKVLLPRYAKRAVMSWNFGRSLKKEL